MAIFLVQWVLMILSGLGLFASFSQFRGGEKGFQEAMAIFGIDAERVPTGPLWATFGQCLAVSLLFGNAIPFVIGRYCPLGPLVWGQAATVAIRGLFLLYVTKQQDAQTLAMIGFTDGGAKVDTAAKAALIMSGIVALAMAKSSSDGDYQSMAADMANTSTSLGLGFGLCVWQLAVWTWQFVMPAAALTKLEETFKVGIPLDDKPKMAFLEFVYKMTALNWVLSWALLTTMIVISPATVAPLEPGPLWVALMLLYITYWLINFKKSASGTAAAAQDPAAVAA